MARGNVTQNVPITELPWKQVRITVEGAPTMKARGFRFKISQDLEEVRGAGDEVLELIAGNITNEGTIKLLRGDLRLLNAAARAAGGRNILDLSFDIVLVYAASGNRGLASDTLVGFRVYEYEQGMEQGDKYMVVELPGKYLRVDTVDS